MCTPCVVLTAFGVSEASQRVQDLAELRSSKDQHLSTLQRERDTLLEQNSELQKDITALRRDLDKAAAQRDCLQGDEERVTVVLEEQAAVRQGARRSLEEQASKASARANSMAGSNFEDVNVRFEHS